jgi:putative nucleotidyltransferase with HDIG domain
MGERVLMKEKMLAGRMEELCMTVECEDFVIAFVRSLSGAIDAKSPWTRGHSEVVATFSQEIARAMGFPECQIKDLTLAGLLHDVGKIGTSDVVLEKPGPLTGEEFGCIMRHPEQGAQILRNVKQFSDILPVIRHHHERLDGSGYPDGLRGESIPMGARIISVADAFEAMTATRPYRPELGMDFAREELRRCRGTQFDPDVVGAFLHILEEFGASLKTVSAGTESL